MSAGSANDVETGSPLEFRRIGGLPPYVFATINELTQELRTGRART